jgi:hypothetical protein
MTGAQASYLKMLAERAHDPEAFDEALTTDAEVTAVSSSVDLLR